MRCTACIQLALLHIAHCQDTPCQTSNLPFSPARSGGLGLAVAGSDELSKNATNESDNDDPNYVHELPNRFMSLSASHLSGSGATCRSPKPCRFVTKRPKKKLPHLHFGPVGGCEAQNLVGQSCSG